MTAVVDRLDLLDLAASFGVVFLRTSGLVIFLPIFGAEIVPIRIRVLLATALAVVLLPLVDAAIVPPGSSVEWVIVGVREISVGLGFGLAARAMFAGIEMASGIVAGQSGFSLANMVDPLTGGQVMAPALFQNMLAIALFLAADLHHVFIRAVLASYEVLPPAVALPALGNMGGTVGLLGARMFGVAVELAAPGLLVTFAVDVLLALVGRAMTQVPILFVGYPLKMAAGMVAMAILAVGTGSAMGWIGRTLAADGLVVFRALAGG